MQFRKLFAAIATLAISFSAVGTASAAFTDQDSIPSWAQPSVNQLVSEGVISGYQDGSFGPNDPLTRAQFAKIVVLAANIPVEATVTDSGFSDVPANSWEAPYVKAAKDAGIISGYSDGTFGPNDTVLRGQAAKILVGAFGLQQHTEQGPNFPDVPSSSWEYPYVETAYYWSVVNGYQNGNYGPNDPITRAQSAVMVVNAQNPVVRPEYAGGQSGGGSEIPSNVLALSSAAALSSSQVNLVFNMKLEQAAAENIANYVVSGDLEVTAAELSTDRLVVTLSTSQQVSGKSYTVTASNLKNEDNTLTLDGAHNSANFVGYVTAVSTNSFTAALSATSPNAASIPQNANNVPYIVIDLTAGSEEDVNITKLVIERRGLGSDNDFTNIYLYDGQTRLTNGRKFSSETHTATFNLYTPIVVPAGRTKSITVTGTMAGTPDRINYLQVAFPEDIVAIGATSGGSVSVSGNFPVAGAEMKTVSVNAGTLTVNNNGTVNSSAKVGETQSEFGLFKLEAANEDILVTDITVENKGSGSEDIDNITLNNDLTGEKLVTVAGVGAGDKVTFDLTALPDGGLYIKKGNRALLSIKADVVGARSTADKIDFKLDNSSDIMGIGQTYGYGVAVTDSTTNGFSGISGGVLIEATDLVFNWEKPTYTQVASDQDDVVMGILGITNRSEDILMKTMRLQINVTQGQGSSSTGTTTYIDNIELVDPSGAVVAGPTSPSAGDVDFTDNWLIASGGDEQQYVLRADLKNTLSDGDIFTFTMKTINSNWFDAEGNVTGNTVDASSNVTPSKNNASGIVSDNITIQKATLTMARATTPASQTAVAGNEISVFGFTMTANDSSDIKVTKIITTFSGAQATSVSELGTSAKLYTNDGTLLSEKSLQSSVTFDSFNQTLLIPAGGQVKLIIKVHTSSSAVASGNSSIFANITADADNVTAQDDQGNSLATGQVVGGALNTGGANVLITLIRAGTLTMSTDDDTPKPDQLVFGSTGKDLMKIKFTAQDESIDLKKVRMSLENNALDSQISKLYLYDGSTMVGDGQVINTNGAYAGYVEWNWSGANMVNIPKDGEKTLTIRADMQVTNNTPAVAGSAGKFRLALSQVEAEGSKNNVIPTPATTSVVTSAIADLVSGTTGYFSGAAVTAGMLVKLPKTGGTSTDTEWASIESGYSLDATNTVVKLVRAVDGTSQLTDSTINTGASAAYDIVSSYFIPYDTKPTLALASNPTYGPQGAPKTDMKVFGFTVTAANNTADTRQQKVQLNKLRLQVSGNADTSDFAMYDAADDSQLAAGTGASAGQNSLGPSTYITFDLSGASNADKQIVEGTTKTYYVKANLKTNPGSGEDSVSVAIANLGTISTAGVESVSDVSWTSVAGQGGTDASTACIKQNPSDISPSAMTFTAAGGSANAVSGTGLVQYYVPATGSTTVYAYFDGAVAGSGGNIALAAANFDISAEPCSATVPAGSGVSAVTHSRGSSYAVLTLDANGASSLANTGMKVGAAGATNFGLYLSNGIGTATGNAVTTNTGWAATWINS